jgi:sugar transferase (PEP-CTERM/EpsH1 system associated)
MTTASGVLTEGIEVPSAGRAPRPVRVMHVVFSLDAGGMELGVVKLVNGLSGSIESSICSTRPAGELRRLVGPAVRLFEGRRRDGNDPRTVWHLYQTFKREQPDIVHTHGWGTLIEGLLAARLARVPVVIHGEHGTLQLKRHQRWAQRVAWGHADRVLSVSSRLAERMTKQIGFPPSRVSTIRNGVDLSRFGGAGKDKADARRQLGLPEHATIAGAVGRLVPVKDHASLVTAIGKIRDAGTDVALVIAGEGPLRHALQRQIVSLGLESSVHLLGHRPDVEMVLAALDVFVLSSRSEGLPNTVLEAMAVGLPVVSTRVGGAEEVVIDGQTGILVSPESPDALAAGLTSLLRESGRRASMGVAGRRRVESEFALSNTLARYEELYLRLAAESRVFERVA